ncbi:MAG: tyrosine-type recombinase/integrase [Gemmataceae bacterium]
MANSSRKPKPRNHQAAKPHKDFPLTAHPSGKWCKKVRGKIRYFGPIADPDAALALWLEQKDDLLAGREPRPKITDGPTMKQLLNEYLAHKKKLIASGELSVRTFESYHRTCDLLFSYFGRERSVEDIRQADFAELRSHLAKTLGPVSLGNTIQRIRSVFKYAHDSEMIPAPVRFGPGFQRPSKKTLRLHRAAKGKMLFTAEEIKAVLQVAGLQLKAMILLALNGGLGNSDLANMPLSAVNLETGWVDYPRPKTGIDRRFPLWPETLEAFKAAMVKRPKPKNEEDAGLAFITKYGFRWCRAIFEPRASVEGEEPTNRNYMDNAIGKEFAKLLKAAEIPSRQGRSFYALRHVFETIAGGSRDQVAVDFIMGHADESMAATYREEVDDDRLFEVAQLVRQRLLLKSHDSQGGLSSRTHAE